MIEDNKFEKRYIIRLLFGGNYKYLTLKNNNYINYNNQYFSFTRNKSIVYKTFKKSFNRLSKIHSDFIEDCQIVEVMVKVNREKLNVDKFIITDKVYTYRDILLMMKIKKLIK